MGYMSNLLVEKTEAVINLLPSNLSGKNTDDDYMELFDGIQEFIMDNGDMINDSAYCIAEQFSIFYKTRHASNIKIA